MEQPYADPCGTNKKSRVGGEAINNNKRKARQACVAIEEYDVGGRDFR